MSRAGRNAPHMAGCVAAVCLPVNDVDGLRGRAGVPQPRGPGENPRDSAAGHGPGKPLGRPGQAQKQQTQKKNTWNFSTGGGEGSPTFEKILITSHHKEKYGTQEKHAKYKSTLTASRSRARPYVPFKRGGNLKFQPGWGGTDSTEGRVVPSGVQ